MSDRCTIVAGRMKPTPGGCRARHIFLSLLPFCHAANGLLHNLKEALLDNVDIYGDCSEFNTGVG